MGSPGIVPFIIFGMATLEKDIQPPTHIAPKDTLTADRSWKWKSLKHLETIYINHCLPEV